MRSYIPPPPVGGGGQRPAAAVSFGCARRKTKAHRANANPTLGRQKAAKPATNAKKLLPARNQPNAAADCRFADKNHKYIDYAAAHPAPPGFEPPTGNPCCSPKPARKRRL